MDTSQAISRYNTADFQRAPVVAMAELMGMKKDRVDII